MKLTQTEQRILDQAQEIRNRIQNVECEEKRKESLALVGKHFKYRNNYGANDPGWWLYIKIVSVDEYYPVSLQFQVCTGGRIEIYHDKCVMSVERYTPITPAEFDREFRRLQIRIGRLTK